MFFISFIRDNLLLFKYPTYTRCIQSRNPNETISRFQSRAAFLLPQKGRVLPLQNENGTDIIN